MFDAIKASNMEQGLGHTITAALNSNTLISALSTQTDILKYNA